MLFGPTGKKISTYDDDLTELVEVQNCHILKRDFEDEKFEIKTKRISTRIRTSFYTFS